ncbi:MAG: pyridoxal phosphate-dependent aminotransferase [Terriglobia bacterium]
MKSESQLRFSSLAHSFPSALNSLYQERERLLKSGETIVDLISGNVNAQGIFFPENILREALGSALSKTRIYQPDSFGQAEAREAVSSYYARQGWSIQPSQIMLTPGSSLSYFYCFQTLADPGDEILCPSPSYPLFETIARLARVELTFYRLLETRQWEIDLDYLESQITTRTRAIVLISPHNPTGAVTSPSQCAELAAIANRHGLPIISDEVFSEFLYGPATLPRPAASDAPLVLTLNGISKMYALPGMKQGWIAVSGEEFLVKKSLRAFEMIADTFLPVNEAVQFALPEVMRQGADFLQSYQAWTRNCQEIAVQSLARCRLIEFAVPQGGFYVTIRLLGEQIDEERFAIALLQQCKTLVHPGYFYDISPSHLVMTFVQERSLLEKSLNGMTDFINRNVVS